MKFFRLSVERFGGAAGGLREGGRRAGGAQGAEARARAKMLAMLVQVEVGNVGVSFLFLWLFFFSWELVQRGTQRSPSISGVPLF